MPANYYFRCNLSSYTLGRDPFGGISDGLFKGGEVITRSLKRKSCFFVFFVLDKVGGFGLYKTPLEGATPWGAVKTRRCSSVG